MTSPSLRTTQPTSGRPGLCPGARLVAIVDGRAQTWDIPTGEWIVLGREPGCDVRLEHGGLSRRHARLRMGRTVEVEDLGSANGTFVADKRVPPHTRVTVPAGGQIALGPVVAVVVRDDSKDDRAPALAAIRHWVDRVADSDLPVIFVGETGVGKSRIAREVHERSSRRAEPFVVVDCSALADDLIEDTLFGHVRGAFTGASADRAGALEDADGGTVFLDEIGDLPPPAQGKLLRAIQEREVVRLGSNVVRTFDVRFLAATHRPLRELMGQGAFREDLYHRLAGLVLRLPALRDRVDEQRALCETLLAELKQSRGGMPRISDGGFDWISRQSWPGNIRELRNVLHRACVLHPSDVLDAEALHQYAEAEPIDDQSPSPSPSDEQSDVGQGERERIVAALQACGGNQTRAARKLGMTRRQLVYRISNYGLPRPRHTPDEG